MFLIYFCSIHDLYIHTIILVEWDLNPRILFLIFLEFFIFVLKPTELHHAGKSDDNDNKGKNDETNEDKDVSIAITDDCFFGIQKIKVNQLDQLKLNIVETLYIEPTRTQRICSR